MNIMFMAFSYAANKRNYPSTSPVTTASASSAFISVASVITAASVVSTTAAVSTTGAVSIAAEEVVSSPQAVMAIAASTMAACFNIIYSPKINYYALKSEGKTKALRSL